MKASPEKSRLLHAALSLSEPEREALAFELLETLSSNPPGLSLDDPSFESELRRRSGDWAGAVPAEEIWSTSPVYRS